MMTIREYFATFEDLETRWDEEFALWDALGGDEDFDLEAWAIAHDVDLDAMDARLTDCTVFQLWCWDMCGE